MVLPLPETYLVGNGHHWQVLSARANGRWARYDGPAFPLSNCADFVRRYLKEGVVLHVMSASTSYPDAPTPPSSGTSAAAVSAEQSDNTIQTSRQIAAEQDAAMNVDSSSPGPSNCSPQPCGRVALPSSAAAAVENAIPARCRFGREYKRSRPFTSPSAEQAKRQNHILASEENAQAIDFDDAVDVVDEAGLTAQSYQQQDEAVPEPLQLEVEASPQVAGAGFYCPFAQCRAASTRWLAIDGLTRHLDQVHVRSGQHPPKAFLDKINRWVCSKCQALHCSRSSCPRANEPSNVPPQPLPASNEPLSAANVLEEIRAYDTCLHHTPRD